MREMIEKFPLTSVTAPRVVPGSVTLAPITGSPFSSTTIPLIIIVALAPIINWLIRGEAFRIFDVEMQQRNKAPNSTDSFFIENMFMSLCCKYRKTFYYLQIIANIYFKLLSITLQLTIFSTMISQYYLI